MIDRMAFQPYVVGLVFEHRDRVLLIRKKRPDWQAGLLNGIGGKLDVGEHPGNGMSREFHEEAGLDLSPSLWTPFIEQICYRYEGIVHYFMLISPEIARMARSMTDELLELQTISTLPRAECVFDLPPIIELAQSSGLFGD